MQRRAGWSIDAFQQRIQRDRLGCYVAAYVPAVTATGRSVAAWVCRGWERASKLGAARPRSGVAGVVLVILLVASAMKLILPAVQVTNQAQASNNVYRSPVILAHQRPKATTPPATGPAQPKMRIAAAPAPIPVAIETTSRKRPATLPAVPLPQTEAQRLRAEYADARDRCIQRTMNSPEYKELKQRVDRLESHVRALRQYDPGRELPKLSVEWIQAKSDLSRMREDALLADPLVQRLEAQLRARGLLK